MSRFQLGWYRWIPFIGYHHVLIIFLACSIVLYSILLAGCSSDSLANIYILSFRYIQSPASAEADASQANANVSAVFAELTGNATSLEVRVGYMGICMLGGLGGWFCSRSASDLASIVQQSPLLAQSGDPLNLLFMAQTAKEEILFSGLIFIAVALSFFTTICLFTFPGWHEEEDSQGSAREVKPFPSRPVSVFAASLLAAASIFGLVAALWQHLGSAAVVKMGQALSYGTVTGSVGPVAMVFGWLSFALCTISFVGLVVMILSIRVLSQIMN